MFLKSRETLMYSTSREKDGDFQPLTGRGQLYVYFKSMSKARVNGRILCYVNTHFVPFPCMK